MNSRRKFIFDCSVFAAALAVTPISSFGRQFVVRGGQISLANISYAELAGLVGTIFRVRLSSGTTVGLKLLRASLAQPTRVARGTRLPEDFGFENFSLIFSGQKQTLLPSAIHHFEHAELGRFEMYLGQIGTMDDDVRYEAGFNRLVPASQPVNNLT